MKKCFKCKATKPFELFYRHKQMADGFLGKCKSCAKKDAKSRYESFPEKIKKYEKKRSKNKARIAKSKEYLKDRRKRFPGKYKAYLAVASALKKGTLKKEPCIHCGDEKTQAHHRDYRKPLSVVWVCFYCHRTIEHGQKNVSSKA